MSWLDKLFVGVSFVQSAGTTLPQRPILDFETGLTAVDDPANNRTKITAASSGATSMPTRGLTAWLNADNGVASVSGNVTEWSDSGPRGGQFWSITPSGSTPGTLNPTGINGKASIDTLESPSQSTYQGLYLGNSTLTGQSFVATDEFSLAALFQYGGTINYADPSGSSAVCPQIWGSVNGGGSGFPDGCGLICGLDPINSNNVIVAVYAVSSYGSTLAFAKSASVPKNVPHYVVGTLKGGNLSIYLDALAPVTTGSAPSMVRTRLQSVIWQTDATTTGGFFRGSRRDLATYGLALTPTDLATAQAFLKADGSL